MISIVIPAFNEAESLPLLAEEIRQALSGGPSYEVLLVDDGSSDESLRVMRALAANDSRLTVLHHSENLGQSAALATGFRRARAEIIVTLDADLQNDPQDIPRLLEALAEADVVSGVRTDRQDSAVRRASSWVANAVRRRILGDGVSDVGCSLKVYRGDFLRRVPAFDGFHRFLPALAQMERARLTEVPVRHRPRRFGRSSYGVRDRLWRVLVDLLGVHWLQQRWLRSGLRQAPDARVEEGRAPSLDRSA